MEQIISRQHIQKKKKFLMNDIHIISIYLDIFPPFPFLYKTKKSSQFICLKVPVKKCISHFLFLSYKQLGFHIVYSTVQNSFPFKNTSLSETICVAQKGKKIKLETVNLHNYRSGTHRSEPKEHSRSQTLTVLPLLVW